MQNKYRQNIENTLWLLEQPCVAFTAELEGSNINVKTIISNETNYLSRMARKNMLLNSELLHKCKDMS
jgi:hypothetical protein